MRCILAAAEVAAFRSLFLSPLCVLLHGAQWISPDFIQIMNIFDRGSLLSLLIASIQLMLNLRRFVCHQREVIGASHLSG